MFQRDDLAGIPDQAVPGLGDPCFDRHTCPDRGRQHAIAVYGLLRVEPLEAGHRYHLRGDTVPGQVLTRLEGELNLGSGGDQDHVGLAIRHLGEYVTAPADLTGIGPLEHRHILPGQRERELARLRDQIKGGGATEHDLQQVLAEEQEQRAKLEAEVAELTVRLSTLVAGATGGDVDKATSKLESDRKRLEERLTVLTRENKKLRASLDSVERASSDGWDEERRESAVLREQINDLAAEVVNLTAMLDEPDSPIHKALAADTGESKSGTPSLAERIRALQKAAATPR